MCTFLFGTPFLFEKAPFPQQLFFKARLIFCMHFLKLQACKAVRLIEAVWKLIHWHFCLMKWLGYSWNFYLVAPQTAAISVSQLQISKGCLIIRNKKVLGNLNLGILIPELIVCLEMEHSINFLFVFKLKNHFGIFKSQSLFAVA